MGEGSEVIHISFVFHSSEWIHPQDSFLITPRNACAARGKVIGRGVQYIIYDHKKFFLLEYSLSKLNSDSRRLPEFNPCQRLECHRRSSLRPS